MLDLTLLRSGFNHRCKKEEGFTNNTWNIHEKVRFQAAHPNKFQCLQNDHLLIFPYPQDKQHCQRISQSFISNKLAEQQTCPQKVLLHNADNLWSWRHKLQSCFPSEWIAYIPLTNFVVMKTTAVPKTSYACKIRRSN